MDCKDCKNKTADVPYIVHESAMARHERSVKRILIGWVITALLWFATIGIVVYAWLQYDYTSEETSTEVNVDAKDGIANYIGNDGDINNGADYCTENNTNAD